MPKKQDDWNRCAVCTKPIAPAKLMCWRHWSLVPSILRGRVFEAWRLVNSPPFDDATAARRAHTNLQVRTEAIQAANKAPHHPTVQEAAHAHHE